ncbi:23S rRNA (guanosine(2251)-2'-O)-methyltransferase RlmB [Paludibacter sp. 221]|uniref:23S rRNA (guanosine(2251)-2'-O)-methyltransferase RlmB n=1 Tax=Paludibacter sp. 221 TaxID=2302939 RepID=UPI0013D14910|nr:23S rRNA (guanosine(2251)-2'-O)-methyltransferase RlmB [Paludibacter sp. 221]NDV45900.1 23S rRNA (guanosine(2251)-2'-O)-methyltransferase RlmB [Paludibacter sp. 221]
MAYYKTKQRPEKEMIFGIRAVIEAIQAGKDIDKIFIRRDMTNELSRELFTVIRETVIPVQKVPVEKLNRLTMKNHQGVIAFISPVTYQRIEDIIPGIYESGRNPFFVVLDGITDVRNFGAIARTCECAGIDAIIIPAKGGAPINADAVKTSAGALLSIPVCREENLVETLKFLSASGIKLVAATEKATENYTKTNFTDPVAIVMGSEEDGVAPEHLQLCDEMVRIPLLGNIGSLNVSVAAGVMLYEVIRQREN